jgi:hypothetical protein
MECNHQQGDLPAIRDQCESGTIWFYSRRFTIHKYITVMMIVNIYNVNNHLKPYS